MCRHATGHHGTVPWWEPGDLARSIATVVHLDLPGALTEEDAAARRKTLGQTFRSPGAP
jgi:hypothetical protein